MAENTNTLYMRVKRKSCIPERSGTIRQYFKDDATAFNAQKRDVIAGKGILNNLSALICFRPSVAWVSRITLSKSSVQESSWSKQ